MRKAMEKWLEKFQTDFSADTANSICNSIGLDGEKMDECLGLCYQLEKGDIDQAEFTGGLSVLTGKKPEEVMGILKGAQKSTEVFNVQIKPFIGRKDISGGGSFTLYRDDKEIGHAMVSFHHRETMYPISGLIPAKSALMDTMEIYEGERGKGYGSRFIGEIEKIAKEQGMKVIYLTSVMEESDEFWRKHGYQFSGRKRIWTKELEE